MIEGVEEFSAELQPAAFAERQAPVLLNADIPVVDSRAVKYVPRSVPVVACGRGGKATGIEPAQAVGAKIVFQLIEK